MKLITKLTYGTLFVASLISVELKADDETIPIQFNEGDVISANVINSLLSRLNDIQKGVTSAIELNGTWNCDTYDTENSYTGGGLCEADGLLFKHSGEIAFNSLDLTYSNPNNMFYCGAEIGPHDFNSGSYDVRSGYLVAKSSSDAMTRLWEITKLSPLRFKLQTVGGSSNFSICTKKLAPPAPVNDLAATVTDTSVELTWVDQSSDEIGFKIQRKETVNGSWVDVTTVTQDVISYYDSELLMGTYWYRVFSTNTTGDSMSSSEVQVIIP
tara:strand:+ start:325 stop:1134 length:810 start_codon:yes stop_codon:yes gene_type:complete